MNEALHRDSGLAAHAATVLTVLAAYAVGFFNPQAAFSTGQTALLLALGAAYLLIATLGFELVGRARSLAPALAYFAVQIPLAATIIYLGGGSGLVGLLALPLASHTVVVLPWRGALAASAAIVLAVALPYGLLAGPAVALQAGVGYLAGVVFVVAFTRVAVREQQARAEVERLAAELAAANQKLRAYSAQAEELAIANERNRLAREIHDSLGHYLTVINVQLEAAATVCEADPPRALVAMHKSQALAQEGLSEVRRSVAALRSSPLEGRPLPEALRKLAATLGESGVVANVKVLGQPGALSPQATLTLYRAAQEALTNIRKHARASRADLTLDYRDPGAVRLRVQDNGVGGKASGEAGFGLMGVRERVQLVGGQVNVRSSPREGFTLEVTVPVEDPARGAGLPQPAREALEMA